jgi:hypothetical protein
VARRPPTRLAHGRELQLKARRRRPFQKRRQLVARELQEVARFCDAGEQVRGRRRQQLGRRGFVERQRRTVAAQRQRGQLERAGAEDLGDRVERLVEWLERELTRGRRQRILQPVQKRRQSGGSLDGGARDLGATWLVHQRGVQRPLGPSGQRLQARQRTVEVVARQRRGHLAQLRHLRRHPVERRRAHQRRLEIVREQPLVDE